MWPYWVLFLMPALAATSERSRQKLSNGRADNAGLTPGWLAAAAAIALIVGYRSEVGGDWLNYLAILEDAWGRTLLEAISRGDPGYQLLNWVSYQLGWGVVGINVVSAAIFTVGLATFCRSLPRPWLALTVAVPYLVIVVGMGYTRQGTALALTMMGLVALRKGTVLKFLVYVLLGASFHKTAVLVLPFAALIGTSRRPLQVVWVVVATLGAYALFLADSAETLYANYMDAEYQSEGALIRLLMNAIPALILLLSWKRFQHLNLPWSLWRWFAWASLVLLAAFFVISASTALDRLALYMLPLQLVVFSSLPDAFAGPRMKASRLVGLVVCYYAVVLFVWLNFAAHSQAWIPYRFYLLEMLS